MAGPPSNGLPLLRVAFTGAQEYLSSREVQSWMPSESERFRLSWTSACKLVEGSHCVAGDERDVERKA